MSNIKSDYVSVDETKCKIMSSYSYLGNHANEETQNAALLAAMSYSTGSHGPRMLLGNTDLFPVLESKLASLFDKDASIVTNSGYMACLGAIPVIADKNSLIFYDARCHSSLLSGIKLSNSIAIKFKHNNMNDLCSKLKYNWWRSKNKILIIESLYSMDGTIPDLVEIKKLKEKYNLTVIIDESHGFGTLSSSGLEKMCNVSVSDVIVGTFSKSLSNLGGFIAGNKRFIEKCEYYSQSNVFTAGLSAYHIAGTIQAISVLEDTMVLEKLKQNRIYMRSKLKEISKDLGFIVGGAEESVVIPIIYKYDVLRIIDISHEMKKLGYAIAPVLPPACSVYSPRFRITATSWYAQETIDDFIEKFIMVNKKVETKLDYKKFSKFKFVYSKMRNLLVYFCKMISWSKEHSI
jgi:7-keto-8-aminopelargonate synthetase-like enzyme